MKSNNQETDETERFRVFTGKANQHSIAIIDFGQNNSWEEAQIIIKEKGRCRFQKADSMEERAKFAEMEFQELKIDGESEKWIEIKNLSEADQNTIQNFFDNFDSLSNILSKYYNHGTE